MPRVNLSEIEGLDSPAGRALLAEIGRYDPKTALRTATRMRGAGHPAAFVAAALTQARLRDRARVKFGADADEMLFTPEGLEQATRASVAAHRAARFAALGDAGAVADLCCGIGGDLVALARAGLRVDGVELDPATAAVAFANAAALGLAGRVRVRTGDATTADLASYDAVFLDPSRRAGGRRTFDPDAYLPPWSFVVEVLRRTACVKVAPGIPHSRIPAGVEAEWVSDGGDVKEAALWAGSLRTADRRATLLPSRATLVGTGSGRPAVRPPGQWLYEPDGAAIRAHLVAEVATLVGGGLIDRRIAYITSDSRVVTPFATAYEVTDVVPFSVKRLRALLRARNIGPVTVKKRGSPIEPEALRAQLRLSGTEHAVVVLTRMGDDPTVLVCRPPSPTGPPSDLDEAAGTDP